MPRAKPKRKVRKDSLWSPILLVKIYRLLRLGLSDSEMCKTLGFSRQVFWKWRKNKVELREAIAMAEKELSEGESFPVFIFEQLSPELKKCWQEIESWEKEENGVMKIELMLQDKGKKVRQQLFLYALCLHGFNATCALRKVNVSKSELDSWVSEDLDFAELVKEIQWHKANFFESSLVELVKEKNPTAVVFANKHFNKERGYGKSEEVNVNISGSVLHGVLDLSELMPYLSEGGKLELLEAIRKKELEKVRRVIDPMEEVEKEIQQVGLAS